MIKTTGNLGERFMGIAFLNQKKFFLLSAVVSLVLAGCNGPHGVAKGGGGATSSNAGPLRFPLSPAPSPSLAPQVTPSASPSVTPSVVPPSSNGPSRTVLDAAFISTSDMDVNAQGRSVVVGRDGQSNIIIQCLNAAQQPVGSAQIAISRPEGATDYGFPRVSVAKDVGVAMIFSPFYFTGGDAPGIKGYVRAFDLNCSALSEVAQLPEHRYDEWFDMTVTRDGVFALVASYYSDDWSQKFMQIQRVDSSGTLLTATEIASPYGNWDFGVHLAVQPSGSMAVVSIQQHAGSATKFRRFNIRSGDWIDPEFTQTPDSGSWYDSHMVSMNESGELAIVQTNYSPSSKMTAYFFSSVSTLQSAQDLSVNPGYGYDTFRSYHVKPQLAGNDFLFPVVQSGLGYDSQMDQLVRFSPGGEQVGQAVAYSDRNAQTLVLDDGGRRFTLFNFALEMNVNSIPQ